MSYGNISANISAADKTAFKTAINNAGLLLNFMVNLTLAERQSLAKMGNNRYAFVKRFIQIAEANPAVLPGSFNLNELKKDVALFEDLRDLTVGVTQLNEKMSDTTLAVGSEAFTKALQGKEYFEAANRDNSGLDDVVAELQEFFARNTQDDLPSGQGQ
jgi:negative regulator of sigma E activity